MDLESRRELYNGFGDAMARGIEYVGTPVLFALMGFGLDRWAGITPVLTIVMTLFAVAGTAVRAYYSYNAEMAKHEAARPWSTKPAETPAEVTSPTAVTSPTPVTSPAAPVARREAAETRSS